ncbi:MAG: hypothetical protein NTY36_00900 [Deltaproteobacteria bacterium]|nr:hypothetical protein [Deltaproteobacteria bacterium]
MQQLISERRDLMYAFLSEENLEPAPSLAETMALLMQRPINTASYRAANFILLPAALATERIADLQQTMYSGAASKSKTVCE